MFTLVTGGLRSGKSSYALRRAAELGPPPWLYVAPRLAEGDEELKARLGRYRREQDAIWKFVEAPDHLDAILEPPTLDGCGALVVDRFSYWLSARLAKSEPASDHYLLEEIERLADRLYRSTTPSVVVTTEVGLGFLPASVPDRRLIDVMGMANQLLSDRATSAALLVSGIPLRLR